jgi:hypothetical protein
MNPGDNGLPTFEVEIRPPTSGKNPRSGDKSVLKGSPWTFEVYLPVGNDKDDNNKKSDEKS